MFSAGRQNFTDYTTRLTTSFGLTFCYFLASVYLGLKGPVYTMLQSAQLPFFKSIGVTGERFQSFGIVASTPWSLKAAIGLLSDSLPILGYHKRPYILISSLVGVAALLALSVIPFTNATAPIPAVLMSFVSLQLATADLLTEGTYAAKMRDVPDTGADVVTFVWGLYMVGVFFGSSLAGPLADVFNPRVIFVVCLPLALQVIPTSAYLPEMRLPPHDRGFRSAKLAEHPKIFSLGLMMTSGGLLLALVSLFLSSLVQSVVSVAVSIALCIFAWLWLPAVLRKANTYMFIASAFYVNVGGVSDYWFTGPEECVPGGPHFSFTFYLTYAALIGSLAGMAGVSLFQMFLSRGTYRMAFCSTLILKLLASLFDLFIVRRDNLRFGIPDHVAFLLGDAVIGNMIDMLDFMPAVVLTSAACPPGMEATIYALLAGFQNFGSNVSRAVGVGLVHQLGIRTTVPCNFDNFPLALVIAHILLPLCTLPLIFVLIPPNLITDRLFDEEVSPAATSDTNAHSCTDENDSDEDEEGGRSSHDREKRTLVSQQTRPIDMELASLYSDSERDSQAGSMMQDGETLSSKFVPDRCLETGPGELF